MMDPGWPNDYFSGRVGPDRYALFLQNAWSVVYAGRTWPRDSWLSALSDARSGGRLRELIGDGDLRVVPHNTTPEVAATPSGVCPPDEAHIRAVLDQKPRGVITCGKQALEAVAPLWKGPLLAVPHPAYRLLTDDLYREGYDLIERGLAGRVLLVQKKGFFTAEMLS